VKRILLRRPSPALVVAFVALFVALGGVSYGLATGSIDSREIADNTIRSKDIRDNSVYSRDLRNNDIRDIDIRNGTIKGRDIARATITGDNVNMPKLGQVPDSAALGGVAAKDYARAAEAVKPVGSGAEPAFAPGVGAAGGGALAPGFWLTGGGSVELQGSVSGPAGGGPLFTLPDGYRPAGSARFIVPAAGAGTTTVTVAANGVVSAADPDASLDGISFRAVPKP
jgi:hypothetical protein